MRDELQAALGTTYTLSRELGGAGMSHVFVATESSLGRDVVIKTIDPELLQGASVDRFMFEVKLAARLQQANIVPLLSAGYANGVPYYTMPFVKGLSLRERMLQGPISIADAMHILHDIAKALAYAHEQGVVHRDIKPENVLLSGGTAMVTDFGIAKALTASRTRAGTDTSITAAGLTSAGSSLGTPAYMAPEQAVGSLVDRRTDLYAWGVVAYELVTGAHPFAGSTTAQKLIAAHIAEQPVPLRSKSRPIPEALASAVMRCLEKDPDRRPASATELLAALDTVTTPSTPYQPGTSEGSSSRTRWVTASISMAVVIAVVVWALVSRGSGGSDTPVVSGDRSLVVLPFTSVGGDTANVYFAEGIADELSTELSRIPGLRLAGRSSAARFKSRGASAQEIGAALKVNAVLDGTVRRAGNRIRVSAELTNASDGRLLWKEQYEREVKDVFAVQDDITRAIVGALQVQLAGGTTVQSAAGTHGTTNLEAYDLYLRALQLYRKRVALTQAERFLTQAISLDPTFARAHATLASVLMVEPYYFNDVSVGAVIPRARAAAERAVAIDDGLAEAHQALGHVYTDAYEWTKAEAELRRAVAMNPSSSEALFRLGYMLTGADRIHEAVAVFERSKAIDPFYPVASIYLAWTLALAGRHDEALRQAHRAFDLDSTSELVRGFFASTLEATKQCNEAIVFSRQLAGNTINIRRMGLSGAVLAGCGAKEDARAILSRIEALPVGTVGRLSSLMYLYMALGDTARGLDAMERAVQSDRDVLLALTISSSRFDAVRSSPRFAAVVRMLNLDVTRLTAPDGGRSR